MDKPSFDGQAVAQLWRPSSPQKMLKEASPATVLESCAALPDARSVAACELMNRPGKRARHMARMARCSWRPEPHGMRVWRIGSAASQAELIHQNTAGHASV